MDEERPGAGTIRPGRARLPVAGDRDGVSEGQTVRRARRRPAASEGTDSPECSEERIGSHAGIITRMGDQPLTLFQIDEVNRLFATMKSAATPHLFNITSVLLQMYSSADSVWIADAYGDSKKVKSLAFPHLVLYGTGVPDGFWEALTPQSLSEGLIGRFLVFEEPDYVPFCDAPENPIPNVITERAKAWLDHKTHGGNLSGKTGVEGAHVSRVEATDEAKARLTEHMRKTGDRRLKEDVVDAAIWSRHAEKTGKLAMLLACSRFTGEASTWPVVTIEDADQAIELNNWLTRRLLERAAAHVSENQTESDSLFLLRLIRTKREWTMTDLTKRTRKFTARQRAEILQGLEDSGEVVIGIEATAGRSAKIVRRVD